MKTQVNPLTRNEMNRLMEEVEKADEYDYLVFYILKTTGRRIGELYGIEEKETIGRKKVGTRHVYIDGKPLEIDKNIPLYKKTGEWIYGVKGKDIDLDKGTMKVWVLKRRNYVQDETVLNNHAISLLRRHLRHIKLEDYVFRKKTIRTLQNRIKLYAEKVGIKKNIVIHVFRHFFISELQREGMSDSDIQILTGHKSISSLGAYKHLVPIDLKEKFLEKLEKIK